MRCHQWFSAEMVLVLGIAVSAASGLESPPVPGEHRLRDVSIVMPDGANPLVRLAASELRRYAYLRTGVLPPIVGAPPEGGDAIVLRTGSSPEVPGSGPDPGQNHALYAAAGQSVRQYVHGATPVATLWAAYSLIETWGFGFYLGGDTHPVRDPEYPAHAVHEAFTPALVVRGNLPWLNFMNSPTTWNPQDYKTFFQQMAKQKANFIGFHAYDHEPFGAYDINRKGATQGGPLMTTISPHRWWSPPAMSTKDFLFGTGGFFDRGEWGCEVGIEDAWTWAPGRATRLQQQMMADALAFAKRRGLQTCLGWEVTGNPDDPVVSDALRRRLEHTLATYPLDYFWIWQSEFGGIGGRETGTAVPEDVAAAFAYLGEGHNLSEAARITRFIRLTHAMLNELAPDVRLIVSGWGGDQWMKFTTLYPGLDKVVPDDVIFAALDNIDPRHTPAVSSAYGQLGPARQRWPIPWFESDGGFTRTDQTGPQTNVTAFEPLLKDVVDKKCQGALGIHWRTRNVQDVAGYLYRFGWDAKLTAADYLKHYARDHYGSDDADEMARVHLRLEELGPQYVGAAGCVECFTGFTWFYDPRGGLSIYPQEGHVGHKANSADHLPQTARFTELEELRDRLATRSAEAADRGHRTAAVAYHDLSETIRWLVTRARVGLAIWNDTAPLSQRLRRAERLHRDGEVAEARNQAAAVLADLEALEFRRAMQALAGTCRTRGELGMLATAASRYGRFYASFVDRVARILGRPLPASRGAGRWDGQELLILYPVPNQIAVGQSVSFDAVLLPVHPREPVHVRLVRLQPEDGSSESIPLVRLGGGYHRAVIEPEEGVWQWCLATSEGRSIDPFPSETGVLTVGPAEAPIPPAHRVVSPAGQKEAVLSIDFEDPLEQVGEPVGAPGRSSGVRGQALDTRNGGFLRVDRASEAVAFDGPFSVAFFARPEPWDKARDMPVLLSKGDWTGAGYFVQLYGGRTRIGLGGQRALDGPALTPGRWTHVVVVHDGREVSLYLDGCCVAVFETSAPRPSQEPLRIGAYRDPGDHEHFPFRGLIDELVFFNRAMTEAEVHAGQELRGP